MKKRNNLVLTGGHAATTAYAVIEKIKKEKRLSKFNIYWIGSKKAYEGSDEPTLEYKVLPKLGIKFININAGKLQTKFTRYTIPSILKIPVGFVQSFFIILKLRPALTLSFGGYASLPVVFWSFVFSIPVILHEQTVAVGRAVATSTLFAKRITLARRESLEHFSPNNKKVEVVGNPVREDVLKVTSKEKPGKNFTLLVMGGSRGSNFLNELVGEIKDDLKSEFKRIIHITGVSEYENYKPSEGYEVYSSVTPKKMANLYEESDVVMSRSGANSVSELIYIKRPCLLIPLPRTFKGEQVKNALYAKDFGIAEVLEEKDVTKGAVLSKLNDLKTNWTKIVSKVKGKTSPDINASSRIVDIVSEFINV